MRTRTIALVSLSLVAVGCGSASVGAAAGGSPAGARSAAATPAGIGTAVRPGGSAGASAAASGAAASGTASTGTGAAGASGAACRGAGAGAQAGAAGPQAGTAGALTGLQFVSADRGWAVGGNAILATADGGRHWARQLSGQLGLTSVDFISGQDGWAVGAGTLLSTTDGGAHWTRLPGPCPVIRSVHFISPLAGFAVAGGSDASGAAAVPSTGGVLLATGDGGRSWHAVAAPANAQTVCFSDARHGWLGANGLLYRSSDGGRDWAALTTTAGAAGQGGTAAMSVECASDGTAWAVSAGPGAAMSQQAHVAYHADQRGATALFAEQYFRTQGAKPAAKSPGSAAGPFSAVSGSTAAFIDSCSACGYGTAPWAMATGSGAALTAKGNVGGGITDPRAASFTSARGGWVAGVAGQWNAAGSSREQQRIVATSDGGRTWKVMYAGPWSAWTS